MPLFSFLLMLHVKYNPSPRDRRTHHLHDSYWKIGHRIVDSRPQQSFSACLSYPHVDDSLTLVRVLSSSVLGL